jgi:hypothetical protein
MTEPTTDFRALCARMADELDHYRQLLMDDRRATHALATEARAALEAQPEPQGPTDEELWDLYQDLGSYFSPTEFARTVLARWQHAQPEPPTTRPECFGFAMSFLGDPEETEVRRYVEALEARTAIQPVPVSKRLPGAEDCDGEGRCWFCTPSSSVMDANWVYRKAKHRRSWNTHWLPHWALPVPGVEGADA